MEPERRRPPRTLGAPRGASWPGVQASWVPLSTLPVLPLLYTVFKFLHVLGVVLLLGNVTATSVWKVFADRTRQPVIVAHAQRLVTVTDWGLTGIGIVLLMVGGYGMAWSARLSLTAWPWLLWSQLLFLASGLVWLCILVPLQGRQTALAARFRSGGEVPPLYWALSRRWLLWGVIATVPLVAALYLMIVK